jgi:hypothetical protein
MNDISTVILVRELDKRLSDWVQDPEPQYDLFFNDLTSMHCEALERALHGALSIHAKKSVERVATAMEDEA